MKNFIIPFALLALMTRHAAAKPIAKAKRT